MSEFDDIAAQRPQDIDEAIPCMQRALEYFHANDDYRALFARAYYIITVNVHDAVHQLGDYTNPIFFDPHWIGSLAGKFSSLYFQSLTTFDREPGSERAWKLAHRMAEDKTSTPVQDVMLGLNAHINYDLAYGIFLNLKEHGDDANHLLLPRRKFDHDQVNNILVRSTPQVGEAITRDYGGGIAFIQAIMHRLDDLLSETGLKYYRERVWWSAISYLTATDAEEEGLVREKLNWESTKLANIIADRRIFSHPVRAVASALRKKHFGDVTLEQPGRRTGSSRAPALSPFI